MPTLANHYMANLLYRKKAMKEDIADNKPDLEGRMTVEDYFRR